MESANFLCTCLGFPRVESELSKLGKLVFHLWKVNFPSLEKVLSYKGAIGFGRCLPLLTFGVGAFSRNVLPEAAAGEGVK